MSGLSQLDLSLFDTPVASRPEPSPAPASPECVIRVAKTRAGHDILVCTADPVPEEVIAQGVRENLPVFSGREILLMRGCDQKLVDQVIAFKLQFPGAAIEQMIREGRP